jgi:hypothetical protein
VQLDGVVYPSVENAYQAAKTSPKFRKPFLACSAAKSKKLGRTLEIRTDWDSVKVQIMRDLLIQKFGPGTELADKLRDTYPHVLIEGNWWNDQFWGVCRGVGLNWLGRLLMEIRKDLIN